LGKSLACAVALSVTIIRHWNEETCDNFFDQEQLSRVDHAKYLTVLLEVRGHGDSAWMSTDTQLTSADVICNYK